MGVEDTATAARIVVAAIESLVHRFFSFGEGIQVDRLENELGRLAQSLSACRPLIRVAPAIWRVDPLASNSELVHSRTH